MNDEHKNRLSISMKKRWSDPNFREMSIQARKAVPLKEFLTCGKEYYSDLYKKVIKCKNGRHRDQKACPACLDRIEFWRENRQFRPKVNRKTLYPWKWNGKTVTWNGVTITIPKDHLFLDLSL